MPPLTPDKTPQELVDEAWAEVDTATTALGTRVQVLIDEIENTANDGLTGEQTEALIARLTALRGTLNGMGANPATPLPDPIEEVPLPGPFADS